MPKKFQKYFIAIVPEGEMQEQITAIKLRLQEEFNLKYALKSPAHITLKMPFSWNEVKEEMLMSKLEHYFKDQVQFQLKLRGIGKFGRKVVYLKVGEQEKLYQLQGDLSSMCKTRLNLMPELSDHAYYPHMTLAYKDTKDKYFDEYFKFLQGIAPSFSLKVGQIAILKRDKGRWLVLEQIPLMDFQP